MKGGGHEWWWIVAHTTKIHQFYPSHTGTITNLFSCSMQTRFSLQFFLKFFWWCVCDQKLRLTKWTARQLRLFDCHLHIVTPGVPGQVMCTEQMVHRHCEWKWVSMKTMNSATVMQMSQAFSMTAWPCSWHKGTSWSLASQKGPNDSLILAHFLPVWAQFGPWSRILVHSFNTTWNMVLVFSLLLFFHPSKFLICGITLQRSPWEQTPILMQLHDWSILKEKNMARVAEISQRRFLFGPKLVPRQIWPPSQIFPWVPAFGACFGTQIAALLMIQLMKVFGDTWITHKHDSGNVSVLSFRVEMTSLIKDWMT